MKVAEIFLVHRKALRYLATLGCFDRAAHSSVRMMEFLVIVLQGEFLHAFNKKFNVPETLSLLLYRGRPVTLSFESQ
jgi:hypothetical protein